MARESRTKYAILGMLNLGPKCGYEIKKGLERSSMFFWNESYGQIYPMLKKLVGKGFATLEVIEREEQPDMKVYTITDDGREELAKWLRQPAEPHPVRNEMLLKMFFGAATSTDINIAHIERLKDQLEAQKEGFDKERSMLTDDIADDDNAEFWLMSLRYGELVNDALQSWCTETIQQLREAR